MAPPGGYGAAPVCSVSPAEGEQQASSTVAVAAGMEQHRALQYASFLLASQLAARPRHAHVEVRWARTALVRASRHSSPAADLSLRPRPRSLACRCPAGCDGAPP